MKFDFVTWGVWLVGFIIWIVWVVATFKEIVALFREQRRRFGSGKTPKS